jgi:hypothetical protein
MPIQISLLCSSFNIPPVLLSYILFLEASKSIFRNFVSGIYAHTCRSHERPTRLLQVMNLLLAPAISLSSFYIPGVFNHLHLHCFQIILSVPVSIFSAPVFTWSPFTIICPTIVIFPSASFASTVLVQTSSSSSKSRRN